MFNNRRAEQAYGISRSGKASGAGSGIGEIRHPSDETHDPLIERPPQLSAEEVGLLCRSNCENGKDFFHREEEEDEED